MAAARQDADDARALERRWSRHDEDAPAPAVATPAAPILHLDVDGADVVATSLVVEGRVDDASLRSSLATLVLSHEDPELRRARSALVAAVAAVGTPVGRVAHAEAVVRSAARRLGLAGRVAGVTATMAAAIGIVGAPVWLLVRERAVLREELGASALLAGVAALVLAVAVLATGALGRAHDGSRRRASALEVVGGVVVAAVQAATFAAVVLRAADLGAWSAAVVAGLLLQVVALAVGSCAAVVAFAPELLGASATDPVPGVVLATPAARLHALSACFERRVRSIDAAEARTLVDEMRAETARLVAAGRLHPDARGAVQDVDVRTLELDAHLAARLALQPSPSIVLRAPLPVAAVSAVLDGGVHGGRLVRRIVQAVSGRRSRPRVPWEAGMLVDLVAAARVPVLDRDAPAAVARAVGRTMLLASATIGLLAAAWTLAVWQEVAADAVDVAVPVAPVLLATLAAVLLTGVDFVERAQRLRSATATGAWALAAVVAAVAADVVGTATPYSPYLVQQRAPWTVALVALAICCAAPCALRVVERMRGRVHDAVHWSSASWPLTRAGVDRLARRRREAIDAASTPHVDALVARLEPALELAVDLGVLDGSVLASLPTRRAVPARPGVPLVAR